MWKARNDAVFNGKSSCLMAFFFISQSQCAEFIQCNTTIIQQLPNGVLVNSTKVWRPPRASFNIATAKGFFGIICRDSFGNLLTPSNALFASSALVAKALALRTTVLLGQNFHLTSMLFELECLVLIQACQKEKIVREIEEILSDI